MAERDKKAPIVKKGGAKLIKKPLYERFSETFFGGSIHDAKSYAIREYIIPGIKNIVRDSITGALDRLLYGDSSTTIVGKNGIKFLTPGGSNSIVPYGSISSGKVIGGGIRTSQSSMRPDIIVYHDTVDETTGQRISAKANAEMVLNNMKNQILTGNYVTVADYKDFSQVSSQFTDSYYGWYDLSQARIRSEHGGYIIVLPPTVQVK